MATAAAVDHGKDVGGPQMGALGDFAEIVIEDATRVGHVELGVGGERVAVAFGAGDIAVAEPAH